MRFVALSIVAAAFATVSHAAAIAYSSHTLSRRSGDTEVTSYRGTDGAGGFTVIAYASGLVDFVRDHLNLEHAVVRAQQEQVRMSNAQRLKVGMGPAKPAKMRSGGEQPTPAKRDSSWPSKRAIQAAKRDTSWPSKRAFRSTAAGPSGPQHCGPASECTTAEPFWTTFTDSYEACHSRCTVGCATATWYQVDGSCHYYASCCTD